MPWWILWMAAGMTQPVAVEAATPARCGWDDYEPNNERPRARKWALAEHSDQGELAAAVCAGDEDWFSLRLERGQTVEVRVRHHPTARIRAPEVYAPRARRPRGQVIKVPQGVGVRVQARRPGTYRVRIRSPERARAAYVLAVGPPSKPSARYPATVAGRPSKRR